MKNFSLLLLIVLFLQSCKSDFKVGADYKDYTIVFGLLAKSDTAQYIKVTKGFYDETQSNLMIAQNPDSLYYNNILVKIEKRNNGVLVDSIILTPVDLNKEGYAKDSGVFAQTPNYAYKFKEILDASKSYRIVVKNKSTGKEVYGETNVIDDSKFKIKTPISSDRIHFVDPLKYFTFIWSAPTEAVFFDLNLKFNYEEFDQRDQKIYQHSVMVPLQKNIIPSSNNIVAPISGEDFYRNLASELGAAPSYITRYVDTPDVVVTAGGQELKTYIDVSSSQGGITYDQIKPFYTNMKGDNVLGLFSSRGKTTSYFVPFDLATIDALIHSSLTQNLSIVGVSSH